MTCPGRRVAAWQSDLTGYVSSMRRAFRYWRSTRPFWAGVLTFLAGVPILYVPYAHIGFGGLLLALSSTTGAGSLFIGIMLMVFGIAMWCQPQIRVVAGIAAILLSLMSFPVANFGGFFIGLLLGLMGGSLACSWEPLALVRGRMLSPEEELPQRAMSRTEQTPPPC